MKIISFIGILSLLLLSGACHSQRPTHNRANRASADGSGNPQTQVPAVDMGGKAFALQCGPDESPKGLRALRKLSNIEIKNTVADIFGVNDGLDTSGFSEDIQKSAGGFDTAMTVANFVDQRRLEGYIKFGESLAAKVDIAKLFPCLAEGDSCFSSTIPKLGSLAWRRPLTTEESSNLLALATQLKGDGSKPDDIARALIQAMVSSRGFLYRTELGVKTANGDYELSEWEAASALSYLILRRPPDPTLRDLAAKGALKKDIKTQAERLLRLPDAKLAWSEFADMWLVASAVQTHEVKEKQFTPEVKSALTEETRSFFVNTLLDDANGSFEQLLSADYTFAGDNLQWIYGSPSDNGKIQFKENQRRGLLGMGAFLASHATGVEPSPITRGAYVMKKMLCTDFIGAPPSQPLSGAAANADGRRVRKENTACASCHSTIDPVGFSYDNFDHVGRFREKDETGAIINTANSVPIDGEMLSYEGPAELAKAIAKSTQGLECFSRQLFRYGMGRMERARMANVGAVKPFTASTESNHDACYISSITSAMKGSNGSMKAGILAIVSSPGFLLRAEVKNAP